MQQFAESQEIPRTVRLRDSVSNSGHGAGASSWLNVYPGCDRISSMETERDANRLELMQGTLDMLILRTLVLGPAHGHEIAKHIQRTTDDVLQVEHGSLYPALHRLDRKGWVTAKWEIREGRKREFKYYRLTPAGKRQLAAEQSKWKLLVASIGRVMEPAEEV